MKHRPLTANDLSSRSLHGHCPINPLNETCEKFFQIWSHQAVNISNDLIEYTIRRMQSDRLRFLFQTRNEFTHKENVKPICQMSLHIEDDLKGIKEHIRCFCLSTRNVYRHLRSDSRLYPKMLIDLDQGIMMKICRFIFKTKVLIQILSKEQHLSDHQREQLNKHKIKQTKNEMEFNDPYRNITKAFIVLQSNFEILYGDILERDYLQNVKTAVQTLPIILDTSKTIRLIFCALYKLSEPARQVNAEAVRQRRSAFRARGCGSQKQQGLITPNLPNENQGNQRLKIMTEILKINQSQVTHTSATTPAQTVSSPMKISPNKKSINQLKTKTKASSTRIHSPNSKTHTPQSKISKTSQNRLSPSVQRKHDHSSKRSSASAQKKNTQRKSPSPKNKIQKKPTSRNKNASGMDSTSSHENTEKTSSVNNHNATNKLQNTNSNVTEASSNEKLRWTTWLHNATLNLSTILSSNQTNPNPNQPRPLLTTWASFDRISKL